MIFRHVITHALKIRNPPKCAIQHLEPKIKAYKYIKANHKMWKAKIQMGGCTRHVLQDNRFSIIDPKRN